MVLQAQVCPTGGRSSARLYLPYILPLSFQVMGPYSLLTVSMSRWTLIPSRLGLAPCSATCQCLFPPVKSPSSGLVVQLYTATALLPPSLSLFPFVAVSSSSLMRLCLVIIPGLAGLTWVSLPQPCFRSIKLNCFTESLPSPGVLNQSEKKKRNRLLSTISVVQTLKYTKAKF